MKDLQPYLDYFDMLRTYAEQGLLEVLPAAHEAYITAPALFTLSNAEGIMATIMAADASGDRTQRQIADAVLFKSLTDAAHNIRTYADFLNANAEGFRQYQQASEAAKDTPASTSAVRQAAENLRKPQVVNGKDPLTPFRGNRLSETFALHVVGEDHPHPLRYTILCTTERRWYTPWKKTDHYEVIAY